MAIKKLMHTKVGRTLTVEIVKIIYSRTSYHFEVGATGYLNEAKQVDTLEEALALHNDWVESAIKAREYAEAF